MEDASHEAGLPSANAGLLPSHEVARETLERAETSEEIDAAIKLCAQTWVNENVEVLR